MQITIPIFPRLKRPLYFIVFVRVTFTKENHRLSKRVRWKNRFVQYGAIAFLLGLLFGLASTGTSLLVK